MPLYKYSLRKLMNEGIAAENVLAVFSDILDGVEAAHLANVIHRAVDILGGHIAATFLAARNASSCQPVTLRSLSVLPG